MPLKNQLHVSQLLSNVSVQYKNNNYIWDKVFPQVMVSKDTDQYRVYDRNFRIPETKRAPKAASNVFNFEVSTSSYYLEQHALKDYIGVDEANEYDFGGLQVDTTENLTDAIYRRIEKSVADLFVKANWSLNVSLAAANAFSQNTTVSDPVPIFDTAATSIINNTGMTPNFGILPRAGFVSCKNHVSVLDRVKYTSSEVSEKMIAALFGIPEMYVPTAVYDSGAEGATSVVSALWGSIAFVGWKPNAPGKKVPSCGYTFMNSAPRVRTWFDDELNSNVVEVEVKYVPKVVASLTGYLIGGT